MIPSLVIMFRETLEAALIVGIVLVLLSRTRQTRYNRTVCYAIAAGIAASVVIALIFELLAGGFEGRAEEVFEGTVMLFGAGLLTTVIFWMMKQRNVAADLERKVSLELSETHRLGLFLLIFFSVLREGVESVIFLGAASFTSTDNNLVGAMIGMAAAVGLAYFVFKGSKKVNIRRFFQITSIILILFAAGMVVQSVGEFQEAGVVPAGVEHVWDVNPPVNPDGSYPLLHDKGYVGGMLKSLFGYTGAPSLAQLLSYAAYILIAIALWRYVDRSSRKSAEGPGSDEAASQDGAP